jgi:hypothetical protein
MWHFFPFCCCHQHVLCHYKEGGKGGERGHDGGLWCRISLSVMRLFPRACFTTFFVTCMTVFP